MKQQTQNKIPEGWEVVKLGGVIEDIGDGGTPSTKNKNYFNGEIPWVNIEDIKKEIYDTKRKLSKEGLQSCSAKLWDTGTVIFSFGASIGEVGIAKIKLCTKQGIAGIIPKKEELDNEFLYYVLLKVSPKIKQIGNSMGSTIKEVRPPLLKKVIEFPKPKSLEEQRAISLILSTADKTIEKLEQEIKITEKLKRGMMKKLLSDRKNTKDKIGNKLILKYGEGLTGRERLEGEYGVYGSNGLVGKHDKFLVKGPGIIVGRKGSIGEVVWSEENFWPIDTTYYVNLLDKTINLRWLYYKLDFMKLKRLNSATGTPGLNRDVVYSQEITFPDPKEQQYIASILRTIDSKISLQKQRKGKLERIKKGLMNELLTGKKRVNVEKVLALGEKNE